MQGDKYTMRHWINLAVMLTERQDRYSGMLNGLTLVKADGTTIAWKPGDGDDDEPTKLVNLARRVLKRQDRIVWAMRYFKKLLALELLQICGDDEACMTLFDSTMADDQPYLARIIAQQPEIIPADFAAKQKIRSYGKPVRDEHTYAYSDFKTLLDVMGHFVGIGETYADSEPNNAIIATVFDRQPFALIKKQFRKAELALNKKNSGSVADEGRPILTFPDGWKWVDLQRAKCSKEGKAMGHCGNRGNPQPGQTILSLRGPGGGNGVVRPWATFILNADGSLGEMKGRFNQKPGANLHPYIVALLKLPRIKAVLGGGYKPTHNFALDDLSAAQKADVAAVKPGWFAR